MTPVFYSQKINCETEFILNTELYEVPDWLAANKLSLNIGKSSFLEFSLVRENIHINISISDTPVEEKQ